jgi:hypothetical protein
VGSVSRKLCDYTKTAGHSEKEVARRFFFWVNSGSPHQYPILGSLKIGKNFQGVTSYQYLVAPAKPFKRLEFEVEWGFLVW